MTNRFSRLIEMLIRHEALRLVAYLDTKSILSIGVGRNLENNGLSYEELVMLGISANYDLTQLKITKEQALILLNNDINGVLLKIDRKMGTVFQSLDEVRQDVIIDMTFNMGIGWVDKFPSMIKALERRDHIDSAKEMLIGNHPNKPSEFLMDTKYRAEELSIMMASGEYMKIEDVINLQKTFNSRYRFV